MAENLTKSFIDLGGLGLLSIKNGSCSSTTNGSNVESTLSMIKAKFGDSLRSKTKTAQVNEALCKILCLNLCCLIQSMFELDIKPEFWSQETSLQPMV